MKIYPRTLLYILPLIFTSLLIVGGVTTYLAFNSMTNLAEKWLTTKLTEALNVTAEDVRTLRKFGLDKVQANIFKAQNHSGEIIQDITFGQNGYLWIVNSSGKIVAHHNSRVIGNSLAEEPWFSSLIDTTQGKFHYFYDGQKQMSVFRYFPEWDWYIVASAREKELYGEAYRMRGYVLFIGIITLILAGIALSLLARRLTAPLHRLARNAEEIGRGDHRIIDKLDQGDEIGTLAATFNRMTQQLNRRILQEKFISDISRQFIYLSTSETEKAILQALEKIGSFTHADRSYVGEFSNDANLVGTTHEWCRQDVSPQAGYIEGMPLKSLPWLMELFYAQGYVKIADMSELPADAHAERDIWEKRGIQSLIRVPMCYGGELRGFVGVDAITHSRSWADEDVHLLMRIGEIFCNTLERHWYQKSLAAEKERLAVTLQSIGDGVITTDTEGKVVLINPVAEKLTGYRFQEVQGKSMASFYNITDEVTGEKIQDPINQALIYTTQNPKKLLGKNGQLRIISDSVAPILDRYSAKVGAVLVIRDITERRRIQEELQKVDKLEAIGILAGGIAHKFNNILTAIIGNVSLGKFQLDPESKIIIQLDEIERASFKAKDLTQQLLTFAKGGDPIKVPAAVDKLFQEAAHFALGGSNVKLELTPPPRDLWTVQLDGGQISQVINNLMQNALHAMPHGGSIHASLENIVFDEPMIPLPAGRFVKLIMKDGGSGIAEKHLGRVFDPFFTTKKGSSGLGLATSYSIIEKHGGIITADSRHNDGTTITIFLPATDKDVPDPEEITSDNTPGKDKILIMDDEKPIRDILGIMLKNLGYTVASAEDGRQMLEIYKRDLEGGEKFDAVIMDLTIPGGMGGKEAIKQLLKIDPQAKAIVSSGYSTDPVMSDYRNFGFLGAVHKPYLMKEMHQKLAEILSSRRIIHPREE